MVKTRQQNAKADANPSMIKFSQGQNDLKIKQVQELYRHAEGPYPLNLYVLPLNYSSTEAEMEKAYYSMARIFHLNKNIGLDNTEMMKIINEAKDGSEDQLLTNDASREEKHVQAAEDDISIPSDHNSDLESSDV